MSLVPTYVKADDGFFYKDPVLSEKGYFICFDDDDPPELVIKVKKRKLDDVKSQAQELAQKFHAKIISSNGTCGRCFDSPYKFSDGYSVFLEINKPIPAKLITEQHGKSKKPHGECVIYNFET